MDCFGWLQGELAELRAAGLAREPGDGLLREEVRAAARERGVPFVDASSNDYLGYGCVGVEGRVGLDGLGSGGVGVAGERRGDKGGMDYRSVSRETSTSARPDVESANACLCNRTVSVADAIHPAGSCASRLLGGTRPEHTELERQLSQWVQQESALLFSSGYAANLGILTSLPGPQDVIFSDELNHASIVDGCRLSKAAVVVFPHRNVDALHNLLRTVPTQGRRYIVTESYFSMDADTPNLPWLRELADQFSAVLIVDEAHALGVFGPDGAGLAAEQRVMPDIVMGTLGKSVGLQGAFIAAPSIVQTWLWNRARSFIYSTASTPGLATQTLLHVKHIRQDEASRRLLHQRADLLRQSVVEMGLTLPPDSHGPIVPIILGDNRAAIAAAQSLRDNGILAYPLRPPTVPRGTSRIRLTVTSGMSHDAVDHLIATVRTQLRQSALIPPRP